MAPLRRSVGAPAGHRAPADGSARARAERLDAEHLWLETSNLNVSAAEFYTSVGFEICGFDLTHYAGTAAAEEFAIFMSAPGRVLRTFNR